MKHVLGGGWRNGTPGMKPPTVYAERSRQLAEGYGERV
jgi:hypothetical protein